MSAVPSLEDATGYGALQHCFDQNRGKKWSEWLEFEKTFDKPGKQGLVGLLRTKDKKHRFVFKISQYLNYLAQHEYGIMKSLNDLAPYCPHFCKTVGYIKCKVDSQIRKSGNPFETNTKYPVEKYALLCEYLDNSCKFYNYIRSSEVPENVLFSSIKQVLMAVTVAQTQKRFTHYDLHSCNIMMKRCNKDVVFLYVLDDENQFAVPTYGHYPVIIDFGFSYSQEMDDQPLWASMAHTCVGFMSDRFDWVADPKLFLVKVSDEIKEKRKSSKAKKFRRIVRNIFGTLDIDWKSGWDDDETLGASDRVIKILRRFNNVSSLFENYDHYCIEIIQTMIILPLEEQNYENIDRAYVVWLKEWSRIEEEITSPYYNMYILQGLVDAARDVRSAYSNPKTRESAVKEFRKAVYARISEVTKFCMPKNVHFEKMLCSLYVLSRCIEGLLYDIVETRMAEKQKKYYDRMPLQSIEQIYAAIDTNLPDDYVYNQNTTVVVLDSTKKTTTCISVSNEYLDMLNDTHPLCRGTMLYDIYSGSAPPLVNDDEDIDSE